MSNLSLQEALAIIQGIYFFLTGVWPLVDIGSFQKVTGPKTDLWLVKTVGALVAVVGAVLFVAGISTAVTFEVFLLAIGTASALALVDIIYVRRGTISSIYLWDAAAEITMIGLWLVALNYYSAHPALA